MGPTCAANFFPISWRLSMQGEVIGFRSRADVRSGREAATALLLGPLAVKPAPGKNLGHRQCGLVKNPP